MGATKIYIVEDEPLIADTIQVALENEGYIVCGMADNAKEALFDIEEYQPDLVLLDIHIEGDINGIELASRMQKKFKIPHIFLTSYSDKDTIDQVKKTNPFGYIVKPFNEQSLRSNIEIALYKFKQLHHQDDKISDSFFIKNKGELIRIVKNEILFIEAFDNYAYIVTHKNKHIISQTLKQIHEKIEDSSFVRIHRSYVVNINCIDSLHEGYVIIGQHKMSIGKTYKEDLMNKISLL